jgi:hypothetical protein
LAGAGGAAALVGIACIIWQAARLLVPIDVTPSDLVRGWKATRGWIDNDQFTRAEKNVLRQYPEMLHFERNPEFVLNESPEYVVGRVRHWHTQLNAAGADLERAQLAASPPHTPGEPLAVTAPLQPPTSTWRRLAAAIGLGRAESAPAAPEPVEFAAGPVAAAKAEVEDAQKGYDRAVKNLMTMVTVAQHQRLFARFEGLLRWLIGAALLTALGITLFAWASNPPSASIRLSGASLTGADLSGVALDGADLSEADLTDANLSGASLDGADLTDAIWRNTTCPDGTNSNAQQPATCLGHLTR